MAFEYENVIFITLFIAHLQESSSRFSFSFTTRIFPRHAVKGGLKTASGHRLRKASL